MQRLCPAPVREVRACDFCPGTFSSPDVPNHEWDCIMQIPRDANSLPFVKTDEVILQDGTHGVVRELRAPDPGGRLPLVCVDTGSNVQQRLGWYDPRELHVGPRVLARLVAAGPTASMLRNLPARLIVESEPERLAGLAGPEIADVVMALAPTSSQTVDQLFDAVRLLLAA